MKYNNLLIKRITIKLVYKYDTKCIDVKVIFHGTSLSKYVTREFFFSRKKWHTAVLTAGRPTFEKHLIPISLKF